MALYQFVAVIKSPKSLKPGEYLWIDKGIFARANKKGVQYGISYTFDGKRRRELVGGTVTLARQALSIRKAEIAQGRYQMPQRKKSMSFDEFTKLYLEHAKKAKRSWKRDQGAIKKASAFFSPKRISEITTWDIERYRAHRTEKLTKATANRDLALLKYMFRLAIDWGMLKENPAASVKFYKEDEKEMRVLSVDEEQKLYAAAVPHIKDIIVIALNTGLRRGEILSLQWDQVDLIQEFITVKHSKSGRIRHVPLNTKCLEVLRRIKPKQGAVLRFKGEGIKDIKTAFNSAVKRAGIRRCRFHDLRHTFGTRLILDGVDLKRIKMLMGHSNISTTEKYAHPAPADLRAAVNGLVESGTKMAPKNSPPNKK